MINAKSKELLQKVDDFLTDKIKAYDGLKNVVTQGFPATLANDIVKLRSERDRVLRHLGEQTFYLLAQGKLFVPGMMHSTFRTAQEIIERIRRVEADGGAQVPVVPEPVAPARSSQPKKQAASVKAAPVKVAPAKKEAKKPAPKAPAKKTVKKAAKKAALSKAAKK